MDDASAGGKLWTWLIGESGAGWIAAVVTVLLWLFTRGRPQRLVVSHVDSTSLVAIDSDVREDIVVSYRGEK
jgi:hypothetical protein